MRLHVDEDELASCVSCGLCLPHCPTFRVSGDEGLSPRGRISAMREVHLRDAPADAAFRSVIDTCVECRGCEPACPSGVPFGRLMEGTRRSLVEGPEPLGWGRRAAHRLLGHHRALLAASSAVAIGQRLRLVPSRRLGLPRLPVRRRRLRPSGTDVWLFTGCVMDAWQRPTHAAVQRVVEATGAGVALSGSGAPCCGALDRHAGLAELAADRAEQVIASMPGDAPVLVDAAGCGAAMLEYGDLLDTDEARAFSARVQDVHGWLAGRLDRLPAASSGRGRSVGAVAVQDPCHLRHVQRAHQHVRTVLAPYVDLVELDDDGLCCGAGGAYAALEPDLAGEIRERKLAAIERSGAATVASANPGCVLHLAAAGVRVRHPLELVDEAIGEAV